MDLPSFRPILFYYNATPIAMNPNPSTSSSKADRKTIEKNRRNLMKSLCSKLTTLVPRQATGSESVSMPEQLEEATNYVKKLKLSLEKSKKKQEWLRGAAEGSSSSSAVSAASSGNGGGQNLPYIDILVMGSALEVVLVTGLNSQTFLFREIIRMLQQDGAEICSASFSVQESMVFHTIHSKIGEDKAAAAMLSERLRNFISAAP